MSSKSVRVDEDTKERLDQLASDEDRPMSRIVANALDIYEQMKLAKISRPATSRLGSKGEPANAEETSGEGAPPAASKCLCPKSEHKKHSWGTTCGLCGTVIK